VSGTVLVAAPPGGRDAPRLRIADTLCSVVANWDAIAHGVGDCRIRRAMVCMRCVRYGRGGCATRGQGRTPATDRGHIVQRRYELGRHCAPCCKFSGSTRDGLHAVCSARFWWLRHPGAGTHPRLRIEETLHSVVTNWDAIAHGVVGCRVRGAMVLMRCVRYGFGGCATRGQGRTPATF